MPFAETESPPVPKKPLSDRALTRHLVGGRELLADTTKPLRLWRRYAEAGKQPTDDQSRTVLTKLVTDGREELRHFTDGLADGKLSLERWHRMTRDNVIARHVAATLATAGTTRVSGDERAALLDRINVQLGYLDNFQAELASGDQLLGPDAANRATLYADAVWATGQNAKVDRAKAGGATEGRRILGAADHCEQCLYEASLDWRPIDDVLPIGDAECRVLCHCRAETRGVVSPPSPSGPAPTQADVEQEFGVEFVKSIGAKHQRDVVVIADVAKVDASLATVKGFHVGPGGTGGAIEGRYPEFQRFLAKAKREGIAIEMSRVGIDDGGFAYVSNGRHRFAVFRDLGARYLPVTVDRSEAKQFRKVYGAQPLR